MLYFNIKPPNKILSTAVATLYNTFLYNPSWIKLKSCITNFGWNRFWRVMTEEGSFNQPLGHGSTLTPHTPVEVTCARHYERPLMSDVANNLLYIIFTNTSQLTIFTTAWLIVWCMISIQTSRKKAFLTGLFSWRIAYSLL